VRQCLQYFLISRRAWVFFLFLVVL